MTSYSYYAYVTDETDTYRITHGVKTKPQVLLLNVNSQRLDKECNELQSQTQLIKTTSCLN